jgi:hypothetical protein
MVKVLESLLPVWLASPAKLALAVAGARVDVVFVGYRQRLAQAGARHARGTGLNRRTGVGEGAWTTRHRGCGAGLVNGE